VKVGGVIRASSSPCHGITPDYNGVAVLGARVFVPGVATIADRDCLRIEGRSLSLVEFFVALRRVRHRDDPS